VVARAQKQDRRIVAWHQHDLDIVRGLTNEPGLVRGFEARFVEGHAVAARWAARSGGPGAPARDDLEPYLALVGYSVPRFAGPGVVEPAIRNVGSRLAAGQDLDASQVQAWSDLLAHQRYACEGLRHLCVRAATELERLDQRSRKARKGRKKRRPAKPAS
jgi:hypothetical protein